MKKLIFPFLILLYLTPSNGNAVGVGNFFSFKKCVRLFSQVNDQKTPVTRRNALEAAQIFIDSNETVRNKIEALKLLQNVQELSLMKELVVLMMKALEGMSTQSTASIDERSEFISETLGVFGHFLVSAENALKSEKLNPEEFGDAYEIIPYALPGLLTFLKITAYSKLVKKNTINEITADEVFIERYDVFFEQIFSDSQTSWRSNGDILALLAELVVLSDKYPSTLDLVTETSVRQLVEKTKLDAVMFNNFLLRQMVAQLLSRLSKRRNGVFTDLLNVLFLSLEKEDAKIVYTRLLSTGNVSPRVRSEMILMKQWLDTSNKELLRRAGQLANLLQN